MFNIIKKIFKNDRAFNYISAILAFFAWGGWAFYINSRSDLAFISAIGQGVGSFISTLVVIYIVSFFFNILPKSKITFIAPAIFTILITGSSLYLMHVFIGTNRVFTTILPPLSVAFIFCLIVTSRLSFRNKSK